MKLIILFLLYTSLLFSDGFDKTAHIQEVKNTEYLETKLVALIKEFKQENKLSKEFTKKLQENTKNRIENQEDFIKEILKQNTSSLKNTISDNIYILEIFISVVVFFSAIIIGILEYKHNKNIEEKLKTQDLLITSRIENIETKILNSIENNVKKELDSLFQKKYDKEIYQMVENITSKALLKEKEILNLSESINRKMAKDIYDSLKEEIPLDKAQLIAKTLNSSFLKYKATKLLNSNKNNDILEALNLIRANGNFPEILPFIENLKNDLKNDSSNYHIVIVIDQMLTELTNN